MDKKWIQNVHTSNTFTLHFSCEKEKEKEKNIPTLLGILFSLILGRTKQSH